MRARKQHSGFDTVAAVDLGSNSFHMIVARWHEGEVITVDRLKEVGAARERPGCP
jgi:exopolyphosphatase / guanosine-5'-triphosphate,3'-diphosphate pyrophosphatase